MNYLGYVAGILLLVWALGNIFNDGVDTSDTSIKDKISIIEKANKSNDPLIKEQGIIAKTELKAIQQKKELRVEIEKEEQKIKQKNDENKEDFLSNPIVVFGFVSVMVLVFGLGFIVLRNFANHNH